MNYETSRPYIASYVILRRDGKIAFVYRTHTNWMNEYYGLASGKVEVGESYLHAAVREAKEEAGVDIRPDQLEHVLTMHRYETDGTDHKEWVDVFFEATSWDGEPYNAEPDQHGELAWFAPDKLPKNTIPSVKFALEQIQAGIPYAEYGYDA